MKASVTTTVTHLVDHRARKVLFPIPSREIQDQIADHHASLVKARMHMCTSVSNTKLGIPLDTN